MMAIYLIQNVPIKWGGNSWIQVINATLNATLLVSKLAKKHSFGDKNLIFFLVYY